jgi:tetratricopeptide (TPR) repeat protein
MGEYLTPEQTERHNELYRQGWALIEGEFLAGEDAPQRRPYPGWLARRRLRRAATCFQKALELAPDNWSAMWAIGKIHQRLTELPQALAWFERAFAANPNQPDVAREAGIVATQLGAGADAVRFSRAAVAANPDDPGLVANLALALLIHGQVSEAQRAAIDACARAPHDSVSRTVDRIVKEVASGARPVPGSGRDLGL